MFSFLLLFIHFLLVQNPVGWERYESVDGGFAILIPDQIKKVERLVQTETGDKLITSLSVVSEVDSSDNFLYLLNYHPVEYDLFDQDSIQLNYDFLRLILDDMAENLGGDIMYSTENYVNEFPALSYRINFLTRDQQIKGKLVLNHSYLYSLQVYTFNQFALNKNMDYFIESFHLTGTY